MTLLPVTQLELTADAVRRDYRPGAIVILVSGAVVQLTSWPWLEENFAHVMARRYVGDPTTNHMIGYGEIVKHTGQYTPLDEHTFAKET